MTTITRHRLYLDFRSREELLEALEELINSGLVPDINLFVAAPLDERKPHVSYVLYGDNVRNDVPVRRRRPCERRVAQ